MLSDYHENANVAFYGSVICNLRQECDATHDTRNQRDQMVRVRYHDARGVFFCDLHQRDNNSRDSIIQGG